MWAVSIRDVGEVVREVGGDPRKPGRFRLPVPPMYELTPSALPVCGGRVGGAGRIELSQIGLR